MNIQVLQNTDTKCRFVIEGVNYAFMNAIRRSLIADVPKLAFEDVTIYDNTSALFDEMLAHRIGLVPVKTDLNALVPRDLCECADEGCPNCTVLYTLSKEGPCTVYSGDMQPADPSQDMPDKRIPLAKLLEGQRIMLEAAAILGSTKQHAKWQLVTNATYREYPVITLKNGGALPPGSAEDLLRTAPPGSIEMRDGKLAVVNLEKAWDYLWAVRDLHDLEGIELSTEPNKFIMYVETDGSMPPRDAVLWVVRELADRLKEFETEVPALKAEAA